MPQTRALRPEMPAHAHENQHSPRPGSNHQPQAWDKNTEAPSSPQMDHVTYDDPEKNEQGAEPLAYSFYAEVKEDLEEKNKDDEPFYFYQSMEEFMDDLDEEDTILCMDGEEIFSAYKPMHLPQVLGAYKRVDRKVKPVPAVYPEDAKVERRFPEDPLLSMPPLPMNPPTFTPNGGRLSQERLNEMNVNATKFLWPKEEKLFKHILQLNQNHFVWEDHERGSFDERYFSPYIIPVISHRALHKSIRGSTWICTCGSVTF